jgi:hypothetical protein
VSRAFVTYRILALLIPLGLAISICPPPLHAQNQAAPETFARESPLDFQEQLDAIRFLQARIIQPDTGYYLVRGVRVLLSSDNPAGVFAYLVTNQSDLPANGAFSLGDFYTVSGYYIILISRTSDDFEIIDELPVTPPELTRRLNIPDAPPPPDFTLDPDKMDYTGAIFNAMDPDVVEWRKNLIDHTMPRWSWVDLTADGRLDCVVDIEGFEFQPTSYYTVLVSADAGFEEGFRSWGYDTNFSEIAYSGGMAIKSERYDSSETGQWLPSWRDFFRWKDDRFILADEEFASGYDDLLPSLEQLATEGLDAESSGGRWSGLPRYAANATRYSEGLGTPFEYYFNLAKIADYQSDPARAQTWYGKVIEYIDAEYDSQDKMGPTDLDPAIKDIVSAYEEWRDEIYSAAEAALEGD